MSAAKPAVLGRRNKSISQQQSDADGCFMYDAALLQDRTATGILNEPQRAMFR